MQPHLNKAFEGIAKVRFDSKNEIIEAMISGEGETVDFTSKVDVTKPGNAGAVECWLVEVEEAMMDILREVTDKSNKAYPSADRVKQLGFTLNLKHISYIWNYLAKVVL